MYCAYRDRRRSALSGWRAFAQATVARPTTCQPVSKRRELLQAAAGGRGIDERVEIDKDGRIRLGCGAVRRDSCADRQQARCRRWIRAEIRRVGKLVTSFGAGMNRLRARHLRDRDGNIWVTDAKTTGRGRARAAPARRRRHRQPSWSDIR